MAGWKLAADTSIHVAHDATATNNQDPANQKRINDGVIDFVNKWNKYFCGPNVNYFSENVLRWEDWPPNALYREEFNRQFLPSDLNSEPETVDINGQTWDLIKVPKWQHLYRDRLC